MRLLHTSDWHLGRSLLSVSMHTAQEQAVDFILELDKLKAVRAKIDAYTARTGRTIKLEIDGGIKIDNIAEVAQAGADTFVAGSAIFNTPDYAATIGAMREQLDKVKS